MWLGIAGLFVAVVSAWPRLRALTIWLLMVPVRLAFAIGRIIANPEPISWQLASAVNTFGILLTFQLGWRDPERFPRLFTASNVTFTTWLFDTRAAIDSYQRHLALLRKYGPGPRDDAMDACRWVRRHGWPARE